MQSSSDPYQNQLNESGATGSDTFYSGDATTAFWGSAYDAEAQKPGSGIGLDAYRILNPYNPYGPYLPGQGQARGVTPTSAQTPTTQTQPQTRQAGAGGVLLLLALAALLASR